MVTTHGSARNTTLAWLNEAPARRTSNRFLPLADMPADESPAPASFAKKRKNTARRKRCARAAKRVLGRDDLDLALDGAALPSDPLPARGAWEELPECYVPELGVMLNEVVTLDSLPRESPPVTFRAEKRRGRRDEVDMRDWDVVSTCSEESFCVV